MEPRPQKASGEYEYYSQLEQYMPSAQMDSLVWATLMGSGRVDGQGKALPVKVRRHKETEGILYSSELEVDLVYRDDVFTPSPDEEKLYWTVEGGQKIRNFIEDPDFSSGLYDQLTGRSTTMLSIEQIMNNQEQRVAFETAARKQYNLVLSRHQRVPAYHVESRTRHDNKEIEDTRIYVPGGMRGLSIATGVIEKGAEFSYAKIWTQSDTLDSQEVRRDTPIFLINTFKQLESVIKALRDIPLPRVEGEPFAGCAVPGLPGVYIGQVRDGQAFNGVMSELFGNAIKSVCSEQDIRAGDYITQDIIRSISFQARLLARNIGATNHDISPEHHAFLDGQPIQEIMQSLSRH